MSATDESETIDAVLERMRYVHEESAWTVADVSVPGRREHITVVGNLLGVQQQLAGARRVGDHVGGGGAQGRDVGAEQPGLAVLEQYIGVHQLGLAGTQLVAVTRRADGYHVVQVENTVEHNPPKVNGSALGAQARKLQDNDVIELMGIKMGFFLN